SKAKAGYTPEEINAQEHGIEAAKNAVYAAQVERDAARGRADGAGTAAGDAKIAAAQAQLDATNDKLKAMKAGGKPEDVAGAQKQLDIARLNLQALEQQVEDSRIRAPFVGVVSQLAIKAGEQVQAYAPIGTFADPSKLGVTVDLPTTDLTKVTLGQDVTITSE